MASLSPQGERSTLALLAEQYATIVDLREALAAERAGRAADQRRYEASLADCLGVDDVREAAERADAEPPPP